MTTLTKIVLLSFFILTIFFGSFKSVDAANISCSTNQFCKDTSCYSSIALDFPAGGGTISNQAFVTLPLGATVSNACLDMAQTGTPIGTPHIWLPASTTNKVIQLKTSDGSLVRVFRNGSDNCSASAFSDPSRFTVIAGGDVWVGNRGAGTVTRLGLKSGCFGDDCYECKGTYSACGGDIRGITFDSDGNIWAGSYFSNCLVRLCGRAGCKDVNGSTAYNIGDKMAINSSGATSATAQVYGLIGDSYSNVWGSGGNATQKVFKINAKDPSATITSTSTTGGLYGIGINNSGDIWVGRHGMSYATKIDGADAGGAGVGVLESGNDCAIAGSGTGLAVDGNNNVWATGYSTNSISVIKGEDCSQVYSESAVCTYNQPHGMAIDFDNNAWLVCDSGETVKYSFDSGTNTITEVKRINLCTLSGVGCSNINGDTYGYSDMTGFRTLANQLVVGGGGGIAVTTTTVCGWQTKLNTILSGSCTCDVDGVAGTGDECYLNGDGDCVIPLSISSTVSGDYTINNLVVDCNQNIPDMVGGLVPCNRMVDDSNTPYNETDQCNLCHIFIVIQIVTSFVFRLSAVVAVFFIIIGGFIYATSGGMEDRMDTGMRAIKWALTGLAIIILSWLIITIILTLLGYIHPFSGQWNIVSCGV